MIRISHIFKKWESALEIDYRRLSLAKFALLFVLTSHWMACLWQMTTIIESMRQVPESTWVDLYPHLRVQTPITIYIAALYW